MNHFYAELQSSPVAIGLLATIVKSSVILVIGCAIVLLQRHRSAALRHMTWMLALASAISLLVLQVLMPSWRVLPRMETATIRPAAPAKTSDSTPAKASDSSMSNLPLPQAEKKSTPARAMTSASARRTFATSLPETPKAAAVPPTTTPPAASPIRNFNWQAVALAVWLLGIIGCATFYFVGNWKLRRLAKSAQRIDRKDWNTATERIASQLAIRRRIQLLCSDLIEVPLTFGVQRPLIILPTEALEWNAQRRETVLQHELAHVARWDALTQLISHLACTLYWFNPLVWFAARSARFERELACDDFVLAAGAPPSEYAGELLTMVSNVRQSEHYGVALAMARRSQFEGRLLALLDAKKDRRAVSRRITFAVAMLAFAVTVPLAAMAPQGARPAANASAVDKNGNIVVDSPDAPVAGISGGVQGGVSGGVDGGVQGGVNGAVITRPADNGSEAPHAEEQSTPAPTPAIAPHAEDGDANSVRPAIDPRFGITGPNYTTVNAVPAIASGAPRAHVAQAGAAPTPPPTPVAAAASARQRKPAVMPPAGRQTGLECIATGSGHHSNQISTDDDGALKTMLVNWTGDDCSASLNSRGDIKFNADFTAIQSLAPDGFVEISSKIHGDTRRLSIHATSGNGPLEFTWWVNGTKQPYDDYARKWLTGFLIELDRHSAWAVKQRFPALMKEGGVNRVLEEVSYMSSDYARAVYLMTLVNEVKLTPQELVQTLNADAGLSSDYETARVLMAVAGKYSLQDQASRNAFLAAIDVINSDYEHARVLMAFFDKGSIPLEMARTVLASASKLKSDYEHARVLVAMSEKGLVDSNTQSDFLNSVNNIGSDYEHSRTLIAFLTARRSDDSAVLGVIKSASNIHSDYEAARVLTAAASGRNLSGAMRDEYVHAAQQIHSEYERNRALAAVGYRATSL